MTVIDPSVKPDLSDKMAVLKRMDMETPAENHRLDGPETFGYAYDIFVNTDWTKRPTGMATKQFFRTFHVDIFMQVRNLKALVWAFEWLQQEYQ